MVSLKKAALAVLALGVTGVASAAMYMPPPAAGCTVGNNVTVPCEKKGWSFAADALYVQTNNIGAVTTTENVESDSGVITTSAFDNSTQNLQPDWNWGFELAAAYYFGTGNDINVNWTHFVHSSDQTATGDVDGNYIETVLASATDANSVYTSLDNNFNAVNIEFGQLVHFGDHVDTRFHAGVQWAQIDQTLTQTGSDTSIANNTDSTTIDSDFDGIGPRFGMDSSYNFGNGFSVFGNLAAAVLVGSVDTTENETFTNSAGDATGIIQNSSNSGNSVVPEAEAKLGVRFTKALAQGDLSAEVGYEAVNYWDAQGISQYNEEVADNTGNFGYDGIFFGLKWMGDA